MPVQGRRSGLKSSRRLRLLNKADDRVQQHDAQDHRGIQPLVQQAGHRARPEQDADQRLMKLKQESQPRSLFFPHGNDVGSKVFLPPFHLEPIKSSFVARVKQLHDLLRVKMMPVFA